MLNTEFISARDGNSRRLLVALHGLGDSSAGYRWLPSTLGLPWMNYLIVDAPDPYFGGFSWYDFSGNAAPGIERSRSMLFELLDIQREKGFATEQTILFGFSQGCLMAVEIGFRYPHVFAGLVGISGYVHEPEKLVKELSPVATRQRMLFTHGTQDPLIPFGEVHKQVSFLKTAGLNIQWHQFVKAHTIAGEEELALIRDFIVAGFPE
jgi:phospholipase/carboxylesterase